MPQPRPVLIVVRALNMHKAHPRTDWTHQCGRCGEPVGIFPSGQKAIRERPDMEIVCEVCAGDTWMSAARLPGWRQEAREAVDFTKKKPS